MSWSRNAKRHFLFPIGSSTTFNNVSLNFWYLIFDCADIKSDCVISESAFQNLLISRHQAHQQLQSGRSDYFHEHSFKHHRSFFFAAVIASPAPPHPLQAIDSINATSDFHLTHHHSSPPSPPSHAHIIILILWFGNHTHTQQRNTQPALLLHCIVSSHWHPVSLLTSSEIVIHWHCILSLS